MGLKIYFVSMEVMVAEMIVVEGVLKSLRWFYHPQAIYYVKNIRYFDNREKYHLIIS